MSAKKLQNYEQLYTQKQQVEKLKAQIHAMINNDSNKAKDLALIISKIIKT